MEDNKTVSIGENLKVIRKSLGFRQHEITGGEITRNLISIIENDKTPLYENVARVLSENINALAQERSLDVYIDPRDLLNPKRMESKKVLDNFIIKLKHRISTESFERIQEDISDIESFLKEWDIVEKRAEIYELLGDIFYLMKDKINEYSYYQKALDHYVNLPFKKKYYYLMMKLGNTCIELKKYEDALRTNNLALNDIEEKFKYLRSSFYFNNALAYKKLKILDRALKALELAEESLCEKSYVGITEISILKANCLNEMKHYDEAISIYLGLTTLLQKEKDSENSCLVYINLVDLYKSLDNKGKVKEYHDKVLESLEALDKNSHYLVDIYFDLGLSSKYLNDFDLAEEYLLKALSYLDLSPQKVRKVEILLELFDVYYKTNNVGGIDSLSNKSISLVSEASLDTTTELLIRLILFNLENKGVEEVKLHINKILKGDNR